MGLWAKASGARRAGRGILFIGPPQLPEAHFIGTLQHRVSPESRDNLQNIKDTRVYA